jgi:hypothetical protein
MRNGEASARPLGAGRIRPMADRPSFVALRRVERVDGLQIADSVGESPAGATAGGRALSHKALGCNGLSAGPAELSRFAKKLLDYTTRLCYTPFCGANSECVSADGQNQPGRVE